MDKLCDGLLWCFRVTSYQRAKVKKGEREIALEEQTEIEFWELTELPEFSLMH